jgi:antitoxin VapB
MENPHPFQAAVRRPDRLACRGPLSHCYPGDKKAICSVEQIDGNAGGMISIMWYLPISEQIMRSIAKLFTHGRSQAVRLPKEFRFDGKEVRISKIGDRVILEPIGEIRPMPWDQIDRLGDRPFMPEGRDQPAMPADRVVFDE